MAEMTVQEFSERMKELVRTGEISKSLVRVANRLALHMEDGAKRRTTGGNPLNVDTGKLRQSIKFGTKQDRRGVRARIQAGNRTAFYARFHEFGEGHNKKRPFLAPSRADAVKAAPHMLSKELAATIRSGIRGN